MDMEVYFLKKNPKNSSWRSLSSTLPISISLFVSVRSLIKQTTLWCCLVDVSQRNASANGSVDEEKKEQ